MKTTASSAVRTHGENAHAEPVKFEKRIGSTVYKVAVHFNHAENETIEDKVLRLIESEARKSA